MAKYYKPWNIGWMSTIGSPSIPFNNLGALYGNHLCINYLVENLSGAT
jgi:hypothetical protein